MNSFNLRVIIFIFTRFFSRAIKALTSQNSVGRAERLPIPLTEGTKQQVFCKMTPVILSALNWEWNHLTICPRCNMVCFTWHNVLHEDPCYWKWQNPVPGIAYLTRYVHRSFFIHPFFDLYPGGFCIAVSVSNATRKVGL